MTYLIFVLFWVPTWILTNHIESNIDRFNIHGIWPCLKAGTPVHRGPNFINGSYPEYCPGTPFNVTSISTLMPLLNTYWTNFANTTQFLEHEWTKHGTCTVIYDPSFATNEFDYFLHGLIWYQQTNITRHLPEWGIIPSNTEPISIPKLYYHISTTYKRPIITCMPYGDITLLDEIWICFDNKLRYIDCPYNVASKSCNLTHTWMPSIPVF